MITNRAFFRCPDCLDVRAVEYELADWELRPTKPEADCAFCLRPMKFIGYAHAEMLEDGKVEASCGDRCIHALFPKCRCECGGENHGAGSVVARIKTGSTPPLLETRNPQQAMEHRTEFHEAVAAAKWRMDQAFGGDLERYERKAWLESRSLWSAIREAKRGLYRARMMGSHSARMKALRSVCPELQHD